MNIRELIHCNVHANIHSQAQELLLLPQTAKGTGSGRVILIPGSDTASSEKQAVQIQSSGRQQPPQPFA